MQGFTKDIPIDNDGTLSANSDFIVPSQKAVKTYVDTEIAALTKDDVGLSNVPNTDCTTTANVNDSTNKRYVTDAEQIVIGNTSGTNTGDNAVNSLYANCLTQQQIEGII